MNVDLLRVSPTSDLYEPDTHVSRVLQDLGMHRAVGVLNLRTWHRYSGVFEFRGRFLRCVTMFDKADLSVYWAPDEMLASTYCGIIARYSTIFATSDSYLDHRLKHHPARDYVRAFHGVPLLDYAHRCIGAVCHWDPKPRELDPREMKLMVGIAPVLSRTLQGTRFRTTAA